MSPAEASFMLRNAFRSMEPEDVHQELRTLFIEKILKYYKPVHKPGFPRQVDFLNFALRIFRFRVKSWCNQVVADPMNRRVEIEDDNMLMNLNQKTQDPEPAPVTRWNLGWLVKPNERLYQSLTRLEVYLLYLTYALNLPIEQVSIRLHMTKPTVGGIIESARRKLRKAAHEKL